MIKISNKTSGNILINKLEKQKRFIFYSWTFKRFF